VSDKTTLTKEQLDRLLGIALCATESAYNSARLAFGKEPILPRHQDLFDEFEKELAFIRTICIQEGLIK
jgi:hypothetical protein